MENSGKNVAIIAYITLIGWIVAIVLHSENKSRLGAFHLRQALGLICTAIALAIVQMMLIWIPVLGLAIFFLFSLGFLGILAFVILGIISAVNEEEKPLPLIGPFYQTLFKDLIKDA